MKLVLFGGTGNIGSALRRHFKEEENEIIVVTRRPATDSDVYWDGKNLGDWCSALESADAVINLAGRRVHCRYTAANLREMMDSRTNSTQIIGTAIRRCKTPPKVWLQSSTATIYAQTFGKANDEATGQYGGSERGAPDSWKYSIDIAKNWERVLDEADTPSTRKVALRSAIMMGIDKQSAFDVFSRLARWGLGGALAGGKQYVSWIHELDFSRALEFLIRNQELSGPVIVASPNPITQREFARGIREAWNVPFGLPANRWMIAIGAWLLNGDSELVLKSRRVVPSRLAESGFAFKFPLWPAAALDLASRMRANG